MPAQEILDQIQKDLGGGRVLLPCPSGKKGCFLDAWPEFRPAIMDDPEHRKLLLIHGNVAVLLGPASGNLVTIDVDHDDDVEPLLTLNPHLRNALRTKGKRGCNIWVTIRGGYPRTLGLRKKTGEEYGEFRSTGACTMFHGQHPDGMDYRVEHAGEIPEIAFDDIVWPKDLELPSRQNEEKYGLFDKLVDDYGEPFRLNKHGIAIGLNESFWAGLHAAENEIVYTANERLFYLYDETDGIWKEISGDAIKTNLAGRILEVSRAANAPPGTEDLRTDRLLQGVVAKLRGQCEQRRFFDERPPAIHLSNTMLQVTDGRLVEADFSPAFRSRSASSLTFDPKATPTRFITELLSPALEPEDMALLQQLAGMFLLGENILQRFVILQGPAACGKSQLEHIIREIVGIVNVTELRAKHLDSRFELHRFRNKHLLIAPDVSPGFLGSEAARSLKGLVGGDWFDAEKKFSTESCPIYGNRNILIVTNHLLRITAQGDADAWRRRLVVIRFKGRPPAKRIANFGCVLLKQEGPGILRWAIEGLRRLLTKIGESGDITLSPEQQRRIDDLIEVGNPLEEFLRQRVVLSQSGNLTVRQIVQAYYNECIALGHPLQNERQVQNLLADLMSRIFGVSRSNSIPGASGACRGFRGVTLKTQ